MRKVTLIGRLADNASVKPGKDGKQFVTFRMACDSGYRDNKNTEWIDCTYGRAGLAEYLTKGSLIYAEGEFGHRSYEGKDGQQHTVMTCRVSELSLLIGSKQNKSSQPQEQPSGQDDSFPF